MRLDIVPIGRGHSRAHVLPVTSGTDPDHGRCYERLVLGLLFGSCSDETDPVQALCLHDVPPEPSYASLGRRTAGRMAVRPVWPALDRRA